MNHIKEQENGANRDTRFICLTADAVSGARKRYLSEGFTDYLSKPIDSKALEAMLMKYLPDDKVIKVTDKEEETPAPEVNAPATEKAAPSAPKGFAPLTAVGIAPEVGMRFCQDDEDLYRSILHDYAQSAFEKLKNLSDYRAAEDWNNYTIIVHAVKSTSKTIGAAELSEMAQRLEAAANEGNAEVIRQNHNAMMDKYAAVVAAIRETDPDIEAPAESGEEAIEFAPEGEDEVLEFNPE